MTAEVLLRTEEIGKTFPPNMVALRGVNFEVRSGEVISLLGANGAGKSTLTKILTGIEQPSAGTIFWRGEITAFERPTDAMRCGIAAMYQELPLLPNLTAAENAVLGAPGSLLSRWSPRRASEAYLAVADLVPTPPAPTELVGELNVAQRQKVSFIRALTSNPLVLIVDEGTSSVSAEEREEVYQTLRRLARERNMGVIYITHFIEDAMHAGDRIVVFRDGSVVLEGKPTELSTEQVLEAIAPHAAALETSTQRGTSQAARSALPSRPAGPDSGAALSVRGLSGDGVGPVSFEAAAGDFIGLYGPPACGAPELLRSLAGLEQSLGTVEWQGQLLTGESHERVSRNVVYCNGDRSRNLIADWTIEQNLLLFRLSGRPMLSRPDRRGVEREAAALASKYDLVGDPKGPVGLLSGGNQQRVVVARALGHGTPLLMLADDVTRGVDVGGRSKINAMLREAAGAGTVILFYSTEPEEILEYCDRVYLMDRGQIRRQLSREDMSLRGLEMAGRTRNE